MGRILELGLLGALIAVVTFALPTYLIFGNYVFSNQAWYLTAYAALTTGGITGLVMGIIYVRNATN